MSKSKSEQDPLLREVRRRQTRHLGWLRAGGDSAGGRLAQIGVLGWIVIAPILGGMLLGRWLDSRLGAACFSPRHCC